MVRHTSKILQQMLTIYKTFVRSHLDYWDMVYDQTYNAPFYRKPESLQYSACLAITGTIGSISYEKLNQELDLKSLQSRRRFRKLCLFYKIVNNQSPSYLFLTIFPVLREYITRGMQLMF